MKKTVSLLLLLFLFTTITACTGQSDKDQDSKEKQTIDLTISAAASLKDALTDLQHTYEKKHPDVNLHFNFGASGTLQQQISQGAPVDLFFSAAQDKFEALVKDGSIEKKDGTDLVGNDLVLIVPKGSDSGIKSFSDLTNNSVKKVSIGTPEAVPAGQYALESFKNMKVWREVKPKLVYAKDVRQVLSYVETGNVDAGVVYRTDALVSKKVKIAASADPESHSPIVYPLGVIKDSKHKAEAQKFYTFLKSGSSVKTLEKYGFKKIN